jgi:hypothetical protein
MAGGGGGGGAPRRRRPPAAQNQGGGGGGGMPGGGGGQGRRGGGGRGGRGIPGNEQPPQDTAPKPDSTAPKPTSTDPKPGSTPPKKDTPPDMLTLASASFINHLGQEETHPSQRLKAFTWEPGFFATYVPGKHATKKVSWVITSDDKVELDCLIWADDEIEMAYAVAFGKLPSKWAKDYLKDHERLKAEALRDFPGSKIVKYTDQAALRNNKPKDTPDGTAFLVHEFQLEQENGERVVRRTFTVPREDGTWVYWTTASGKATDPKRWTVQHFQNGFRLTDVPSGLTPLTPGGAGGSKGSDKKDDKKKPPQG